MRHLFGPWPLRPFWTAFLLFTVQNFGIGDARLFVAEANVPSSLDPALFGFALSRVALSLALAVFVVAAEWVVWWVTTLRRSRQSMWAYILMIVVGAAAAAVFRVVLQSIEGFAQPIPDPIVTFLHYAVLLVILHVSIGLIGSHVSDSAARAQEALTQLREQERRFVESEERARRIAAEFLHDRVQADLLVIAIELRRVAEDAPEDLSRRIASITEAVETVRRTDVRDTSRALSPLVQETGLASALTSLAQRWSPAMHVSVAVDEPIGERDASTVSTDTKLGIYRIVEQALLNAAGHAQARQVQVSVTRDGARVRVRVTDDGRGFDPNIAATGGGFAVSEVWARLLGGTWSVTSRPGDGATVTAWIPISSDA